MIARWTGGIKGYARRHVYLGPFPAFYYTANIEPTIVYHDGDSDITVLHTGTSAVTILHTGTSTITVLHTGESDI